MLHDTNTTTRLRTAATRSARRAGCRKSVWLARAGSMGLALIIDTSAMALPAVLSAALRAFPESQREHSSWAGNRTRRLTTG